MPLNIVLFAGQRKSQKRTNEVAIAYVSELHRACSFAGQNLWFSSARAGKGAGTCSCFFAPLLTGTCNFDDCIRLIRSRCQTPRIDRKYNACVGTFGSADTEAGVVEGVIQRCRRAVRKV